MMNNKLSADQKCENCKEHDWAICLRTDEKNSTALLPLCLCCYYMQPDVLDRLKPILSRLMGVYCK